MFSLPQVSRRKSLQPRQALGHRQIKLQLALLALTLGLTSCFGSDPDVGVRLVLKADNSGKIYTRSLVAEDVRSALASGSTGADWEHHAQIVFGRGGFKAIGDLKLEEIGFELASADRGFSILTVTLPRGPEMRWPAALTSRQAAMRLKAGETLKPDSASAVGDRIELSIEFPTDVISQGVRLRARGVDGSHEREIAKLVVTADAAQVEGEDLVWIITW